MDIKFNYNDTISTVNSKKPEVVDLETKDPVLLKSNKSADTVLPISPNDTTINTDDIITSSDKQYTVEVTNPEDPHVIGHTRNFYRGRSFRFAGIWTKGVHYICDEYVVDFVVKDNTLLACSKSHMSTSENEPVDFVYKDGHMVGIVSDYWDFVLTGAAGKTGGVYLPSYDEENDQLVWTLITEDLDDTVYTPLGLKVQIDKALAPIVSDVDILKDGITSLNLVTTRISSDVTGLEQRVENAEGNIGQLRLDADAFDVRMSDAEGNIGQLALTAREFSVEMSNVQGDVGRLWLTAQEFGVRMSNAEGDVSLLKQTADEIQTRVENAEGDISQIHQRADEISSQVENAQGDISRIEQKANSIESTVQDAQGDISQLKQTATEISTRVENNEGDISRISQRADEIESTVENAQGDISQLRQTATEISSTVATNKELADGAIAENRSLISQTAEEIRSEVESNVTRLGGEIEQNRSEIRQTAEEITSTVERNKQETDGAIESAKSEFKQTADEISATVERNKADTDGQIETTRSEIRQTADAITSTVEANKRAVDGSILELNSTITQTAEEIRAEVARVETDVNGNIEDAKSEMKQTADEISATVARNKSESDGSFQSVSSQLSIQADQIQSTVDSIESVEDRVTTSESNITQLSNEISTKVSQTDFNTKTQQIESSISTIDQKADGIRASVTTLSGTIDDNARAFSDYATATDAELVEMQRQLDGAIESWFYEGVPTLNNVPASNWTTVEDKNVHLGDLYYDKLTGYAYRFMHDETNGYYWTRIEDSDITLALENAAKAQDTADNKRRVFLIQPIPPYDAGDLWVQGHTANNDGVIFRCVNSRQSGTFISSDWELASDSVTTKIARSNFEVLSNAIVGTVSSYTYDSNGVLDSATQSRISQTADAIRLSISNGAIGTALGTNGAINSALLDTGIDITNGDITLTANHIKLQNQNAVSGLELITTGSGSSQRVVIDVSSLNVSGIFTTQAWSGTNGVRAGIISDANTYANTVAGNAQTNAINDTRSYVNSTDYLNDSVVPLITNATSVLAKDSDYNYLKAALLDGTTTVAGGLVLSSLIKLGYNAGTDEIPDWQIMSGINGVAVPTEPGKGIAAWYGGDMEDGEKSGASANAAKSLFRMDGSGYLAGGQISWGNTGSIVIHGATLQGTNGNITTGELVERILEIGSWFVKDSYVDGNGVTRYYLRLVCGDTTNLAGFASDGFVSAGGLGSGGGTAGADLPTVWTSLRNVTTTASEINSTIKIAAAHIPDMASTYGYLKAGDVSGVYLPLTGGTLTGSGSNDVLIKLSTESATSWMGFRPSDGTFRYIGINNSNELLFQYANRSYTVWHSGNFIAGTNYQAPISDLSTIRSNASNGNTAYGWGNHASKGYITGINSSMVTTALGYTPANVTALNSYVEKAGDTMTGDLNIASATARILLKETSTGSYNYGLSFGFWDGVNNRIENSGRPLLITTYSQPIGIGRGGYGEDIYINASGNVGVGTTSPGYKLDVSGTFNATTIYQNGVALGSNAFSSTSYLPLSGGTMNNTNLVTNFNADLLDGQHGSYYNNLLTFYDSGATSADSVTYPLSLLNIGTPSSDWWYVTTMYHSAVGSTEASQIATSYAASVPQMYIRQKASTWTSWEEVYHSGNLTKSVITNLIGTTTYAPYNSAGYLPLSAGAGNTLTGQLFVTTNTNYQLTLNSNVLATTINFNNRNTTIAAIQAYAEMYGLLMQSGNNYINLAPDGQLKRNNSDLFYHSGNSNKSDVAWSASTLTTSSYATIGTTAQSSNMLWVEGTSAAWASVMNNTDARVYMAYAGYGITIVSKSSDASKYLLLAQYGATDLNGAGGSTALYVRADGNVGIGTTSPAYKLDVNGSIGCYSLTASGMATMSGGARIDGGLLLGGASAGKAFIGDAASGLGGSYTGGMFASYGAHPLYFYTNSSNRMVITGDGNVGIGTTSPVYTLDVTGNIYTTGAIYVAGNTANYIYHSSGYLSINGIGNEMTISGADDSVLYINYRKAYNGHAPALFVWNVGSASTFAQFRIGDLDVRGNILATGAITAGSASDIRLKSNVQTLSSSYAKFLLMALRPVSFTWNSIATELYSEYKGNDIGLIAQEVEELLPQAIGTIYEKYKRLDYTKFIPPIITVVQDHEKRIRELEEENKRLKELLKINEYGMK